MGNKMAKKNLVFLIVAFGLYTGLPPLFAQSSGIGADGKSLEIRKQEWLSSLPSPGQSLPMWERHSYLLSWLYTNQYNSVVSETIHDMVDAYWMNGQRLQHAYAANILISFGSRGNGLISVTDEEKIHERYERFIARSDIFSDLNPNKQIAAMAGVYLYTKAFDRQATVPIYGYAQSVNSPVPGFYKNQWPSFDYNGHSYEFGGGPYNAEQMALDWLEWIIDGWFVRKISPRGNREFDSIVYSRAYPAVMALLAEMAPDASLRKKAKMVTDLFHVDAVMDYSANAWGGTMGRNDYSKNSRAPIYPFHHYFGMGDVLDGGEGKWGVTATYFLDYKPSNVIVDVGVLDDEPDNYWHLHKEYNEGLLNNEDMGKWNFVTKFYNLGSNVGQPQQGWQLSVKGNGRTGFIRLWLNGSASEPPANQEVNYLGDKGRQFRNALFAPIGSKPYLWEQKNRAAWEAEDRQGVWEFKKLGKVMVAIGKVEEAASVEVAISGVDYSNFSEFKSAINNNASLTNEAYITSRGDKIGKTDYCGINRPGDIGFPFKRIETVDYRGSKIVSWKNNVMTVARHGQSATYNFNTWTYSEDITNSDSSPPSIPQGVEVSTSN